MALKIAFQMDHISTVDIKTDSTFALALEAEARGHTLYHYLPEQLFFQDGKVQAKVEMLNVSRKVKKHFTLSNSQIINLKDIDVVLLRQDPPFDMSYITTTHLLELVQPDTLVVNDPVEVRNAPEKIFILRYPNLLPPTIISREKDSLVSFRAKYSDIILKPLYGNGGSGVYHIKPDDENFISLLEMFEKISREPIIAQAYLPDVRKGDKRIILIEGEVAGAINRVPKEGEARANIHTGATTEKSNLNDREIEICKIIGPDLKKRGLIFVGIDIIGDYLTEINVTSPTGIQEINHFDKTCIESQFWDAIEKRF
ncbi:MAG: glutathione synthase [Pseudomonadota bacterium]|nr:glutathione synthase [Pseudomonadota bacterium]